MRDEVRALYRAVPEPMLAVVEALLDRQAQLEAVNATLRARVKALEDRLARDSHNRSTSPSSDVGRPKPAPRSLRPAPGSTGRAPGGQPGHPGTTVRLVDTPDHLLVQRPAQCAACGHSLVTVAGQARLSAERRQVVDLPPLALAVTEHRVAHVTCPGCGVETAGTFPVGVTQPVQYGERLKAVAVYLHAYQLLPYGRASELLDDLFGAGGAGGAVPCARTLEAAGVAAGAALAPVEAAIVAALRGATVAGFDETSVRAQGTAMHDAWAPYLTSTENSPTGPPAPAVS